MKTAHTPGPWLLGNEDNAGAEVECGKTRILLDRADPFTGDYVISRDELLANTHLVMAAPDLLAAAEAMRTHIEDIGAAGALAFAADPIATARYDALSAAISKARGES